MAYLQQVQAILLVPLVAHVAQLVTAAYLDMQRRCRVVTRQTIAIQMVQVVLIHLHAAKRKR